jgi:hypothetical protein
MNSSTSPSLSRYFPRKDFLPSETLPIVTQVILDNRYSGTTAREAHFRNSAERLKEFPQCAFCHVKGKISDVKLHDDR